MRFTTLGISFWMLRNPDGIIVFLVMTAFVTLLVLLGGAVFWHECLGKGGAVTGTLLLM
ncbi:MAG: hypothetical protein R6V12_17915 [Candidatus Hydrogenedentota bacterium]